MNLNKWTELTEEELMNTEGGSITIATVGAGLAIFTSAAIVSGSLP